ncbi:MAG: hypothetical protein LBU28_09615 [Spirochaetaceae bacterium]|jgi:hypothetical protein|nr:hypothetical protein [Spirochaetaceae bacterium]
MKNKYRSEALQVIHEDMEDMHQLGIISDGRMKEFDEMCLAPDPETAPEGLFPKAPLPPPAKVQGNPWDRREVPVRKRAK